MSEQKPELDSYRAQLAAEIALENTYRSRIEPAGTYLSGVSGTTAEDKTSMATATTPPVFEPALEDLTHTRSCPMLNPMSDEFCTCGLNWRIRLRTEMEMHNAWRKRAEEAEAALTSGEAP